MQVILLERVAKLGQMGDVVDVKPGYARNFLLPQGKALSPPKPTSRPVRSPESAARSPQPGNQERSRSAGREKLDGQQFIVIRSASDAGALYGSVTPRDAADAATEAGFSVDKKQVALASPDQGTGPAPLLRDPAPRSRSSDPD